MDHARVILLLRHPAAKLLRAEQAAFALAFLHTAFKESAQAAVPEELLRTRLDRWIEERRAEESFAWERSARDYLEDWCGEDRAWLRKVHGSGLEPAFELTSATEKALGWLDSLRGTAFVGTESRLEGIFREIDELLRYTSNDVDARLEYLRAERAKLDDEIARILDGGAPQTFEPWQINERYAGVLDAARSLVSDFREVEENFRRIAQEVVERQTQEGSTKGEIVGRVLDSHDSVRESPQGRSFYGFVRLLLDPDRRERFEEQVAQALAMDALDPSLRDDPLLRQLLPRLRGEQEKVGASTHRLTSNLRRALETARLAERRRVRELIGEIQTLALRTKDSPPPRADFFEVEEMPAIWAGLSRPLWDEGAAMALDGAVQADDAELDWAAFARLQNLPHLSLDVLRRNVGTCLAEREFVLLSDVLARFPATQGVMEVVGYLIVAGEPPHYFARDQHEDITFEDGARWRFPRVLFCRETPASAVA
ncbi:MAG: DUF3375 domain-containing protein [Chthoniobacterales bacterium]|nr:DUF3375 domain-containing protein [Chthoniobacterales bacterium]